ncbi:Protein of unknown function [Pyronema omphalodes CBS 100304]|uniref:Uncharacterized protein n=1 Tax=Pyronema omphalodes (strain CBS 100304) TaxID=1076935 RepID=U4KU42_PYROM|nr:Protein of unknown function [Pyronema omphalodes CBS 100304]
MIRPFAVDADARGRCAFRQLGTRYACGMLTPLE